LVSCGIHRIAALDRIRIRSIARRDGIGAGIRGAARRALFFATVFADKHLRVLFRRP